MLLVIGLSGAVLSFRAEITDLIDPGLRRVPHAADAQPLTPAELLDRLQAAPARAARGDADAVRGPGRPARVNFAPPPGERRGETRLADPYTAALLPEPRAEAFFEFVESLHRWLLMPRDTGKSVTGTLAAGLLVLALSGLYLRWPRRPLAWRNWLRLDFALSGRAFLWNLHAVAGTVALLAYLVSASTGIYWGFDAVRTLIDDAAGEGRSRAHAAHAGRRRHAGPARPAARVALLPADDDAATGARSRCACPRAMPRRSRPPTCAPSPSTSARATGSICTPPPARRLSTSAMPTSRWPAGSSTASIPCTWAPTGACRAAS